MLPRTLPAGFIQPCLPTKATKPPSGALWLHEIKHDGFRVIARKDGARVKLYSRPGNSGTRAAYEPDNGLSFPSRRDAVAAARSWI